MYINKVYLLPSKCIELVCNNSLSLLLLKYKYEGRWCRKRYGLEGCCLTDTMLM